MPKEAQVKDTVADNAVDTKGLTGDKRTLFIALERFRICNDVTSIIRSDALEDLRMYCGKQWLENILSDRVKDKRPALTINKIPSFVNQVTNDARQNKVAPKVRPVDNVTDPDTAEVIDGLVRSILKNSESESAFSCAQKYQVICGFGYYRLLNDYLNDESFEQELRIEKIENPFSVYFPVHLITTSTFSDAPYCFIRQRISKDEFKARWPNNQTIDFMAQGQGDINWTAKDHLYIAEYFDVVETPTTIYLMSDGSVIKSKEELKAAKESGLDVVKERETLKKTVKWYLMTEAEILETKTWPSPWIPVIPVLGEEVSNYDDTGKKVFIGLVRFMKDPQRMYNYWITTYTERLALEPKAPFIAADGQIESYTKVWSSANTKNHGVLPYKPMSVGGTLVPPPQRLAPPQAGDSLFRGVEIASQEMKEVSGIYDASLGSRGNETSGKAIVARQRQGDTANFHFIDNFALSIKHLVRVIVDTIPYIYDSERAIRILGEDMTEKVVTINQQHPDKDGKLYDLTVGKYDVAVTVGPSYDTKRIETAETLANLLPQIPAVGAVAPDLIMRMLDNTMSNEIADRLKRFIQAQPNMQGVIDDGKDAKADEMGPQAIQAMVQDIQKLQSMHQMTMQENQQLQGMVDNLKKALNDKSMEIQAKVHDTEVKAETELKKAQMELAKEHLRQANAITSGIVNNAVKLHQIGNSENKNNIAKPPAGSAESE
jgi:hypothetical protein